MQMPGNIGVLVFKNIRPEINNLPILIQLPDFAVICHTDSKRCNIRRGRHLVRKQLHNMKASDCRGFFGFHNKIVPVILTYKM